MKRILVLFLISAVCLSADSVAALSQARAAMNRGELVNAEQILNAAIQDAEANRGGNSSALDAPLDLLVQVYQREKRFADADAVEQRRVGIWTAMCGDNAVIVGRVLGQAAIVERQGGLFIDAEAHARRALAILTAAYIDKPPAAQAAMDLGDVLAAEHRSDEAEQVFALAQKTFEISLGPDSLLTTAAATRRASILRQSGHPAEADQLARTSAGGVFRIGGSGANQVFPPRILSKVEPKYSEEARKKKLQGSIQLSLVIDATGTPTQIAVIRPLGMGLDEKAIEAVSQWKFAPGTKNGTPVPVFSQIEITFHLL